MRTTLWRYHLGGGCALALAYVYLPFPPLRIAALVALRLATIAATLASVRLWSPARRLPFHLFAAGEAVGFVAGSLGSSAAVTRAGGSVAAAALTCVAYLIGIAGYALLIRTRSPGRDHAGLIDATVISTGVGMLAWVFLASPYSVDDSLPLVERGLSVLSMVLDVLVIALVIRLAIGGRDPDPGLSADDRRLAGAGGRRHRAGPAGAAGHLRPGQPGRGRLAGRLRPVGRGRAPSLGGHPHRPGPGPAGRADPGPAGQPGRGVADGPGHPRHPGPARPAHRRAGDRGRLRPAVPGGPGPNGRAGPPQRIHRARASGHLRGVPELDAARRGRSSAGSWWSTTSRSSTCTPAGSPGPRRWSAGPARTAGWSPGRVHPPGRGDRPGGRARPVRPPPGLPPGGRLGRRRRPSAAARQPLRPPPAPQRPGRQRGRRPARLRPAARVPGPGAHRERAHARPGGGHRPPARAQRLGVGQAIDDFGTGYSSLAYLRQMPIDAVKIDKSFVDGVAEESAVARAIIALATTLHLDTVAEGVERPEQATALAELGCHLAQGYHFSRPIPAADMARLTGQHPVATTLSHPA